MNLNKKIKRLEKLQKLDILYQKYTDSKSLILTEEILETKNEIKEIKEKLKIKLKELL